MSIRLTHRLLRIAVLTLAVGLARPSLAQAQIIAHTVAVTTDGSGNATGYTPSTFGLVRGIRYVPDPSTPLSASATVTITENVTGLNVVTLTGIGPTARDVYPRVFTINTTGTAALYASGGLPVLTEIPVAGPVKIVIASGGVTTSGTFYVYIAGR